MFKPAHGAPLKRAPSGAGIFPGRTAAFCKIFKITAVMQTWGPGVKQKRLNTAPAKFKPRLNAFDFISIFFIGSLAEKPMIRFRQFNYTKKTPNQQNNFGGHMV
jgi:hypothetical protein